MKEISTKKEKQRVFFGLSYSNPVMTQEEYWDNLKSGENQ